ncbi:MAG: hypothetical protein AAGB13_08950 [Cyanobacteria bacterium P01_F01_bin.33]
MRRRTVYPVALLRLCCTTASPPASGDRPTFSSLWNSLIYEWAAALARVLYPLWASKQRRQMRENDRRRQDLARQAPCLIACEFEQW